MYGEDNQNRDAGSPKLDSLQYHPDEHAPLYRPVRSVLFAVLTGVITHSSRSIEEDRGTVLDALRSSFLTVTDHFGRAVSAPFDIFRGDSFQGILSAPEHALRAAIMIRASLRHLLRTRLRRDASDARIAIGIGSVDYLPGDDVLEGDGEAYRRSGPVLDDMRGNRHLLVSTPWPEVDSELDAPCALLDALVECWSPEQARAVLGQLQGKTQDEIAGELGISQPAVGQRLSAAGGWAVEAFCLRYEQLIGAKRLQATRGERDTSGLPDE